MQPIYALLQLDLTEQILLKVRRHWIIMFKKFLIFLGLTAVLIIAYAGIVNFVPELLIDPVIMPILVMVGSLYFVFIWVMLFHQWIDYYLDLWIVTDKQVIDVKQEGIFNRTVARQPLFRIQDVMAECKGVLPTLFHYGDVKIQTAGAKDFFIFKQVPNPFELAAKINDLIKYPVDKVLEKK